MNFFVTDFQRISNNQQIIQICGGFFYTYHIDEFKTFESKVTENNEKKTTNDRNSIFDLRSELYV